MTALRERAARAASQRPRLALLVPGKQPVQVTMLEIVAELGGHSLEILAAQGQLSAPVHRVVIWDAQTADDIAPGDLILAVGTHDRSAQFATLLDQASSRRAAGIVIKAPVRGDWVRFAAERSGLAVLVAPEVMAWDWLHAALHAMVRGTAGEPDGPADLFALADAAAAALDGPVEIDDSSLRLLSYSNLGHELDELRVSSILNRVAPPDTASWLRGSGSLQRIRQARGPVRITPPGSRPRLVTAIRAGMEILGYIWLTEDSEHPGTSRQDELSATARVAAATLLRGRSADDVTARAREVLLRGVMDDTGSAATLAEALGTPVRGAFRMVAIVAAGSATSDEADRLYLQELIRKRAQLAADGYAAATAGNHVYLLLPADRLSLPLIKKLAADITDRVASHLGQQLFVAIGDQFEDLASLSTARRAADRMLSIIAPDGSRAALGEGRVVVEEDLRPQLVLHELHEFLHSRPHLLRGRLACLEQTDRTQNTVYIATLRAYFDASGDMMKAAQLLFVHRNTLRYRLRKIQDICGLDLENPDDRLVAEIQLRLGW